MASACLAACSNPVPKPLSDLIDSLKTILWFFGDDSLYQFVVRSNSVI